jgi:hypothetical protein
MSTKFEYYITGDDDYLGLGIAVWGAQTFTPSVAHTITSVKLKLYRYGSETPGIITVSIKAVDANGRPTGPDLCSGTMDGVVLNGTPTWYEITLGAGYGLSAGTKYAIVVRAPNASWAYALQWRADWSSATYSGGCVEYSTNSGVDWTDYATQDMMFEEWGVLNYDETAKLQVVLAAQGKTDTQAMAETAKLQVVLAVQGEADSRACLELGKEQVILSAQGEFDSYAKNELAREQVILAVLSEADIQAMVETARLQVALAAQGITDIQTMLETARLQVVLAAQGEAEHLTLGELAREQVILAVLGEADQFGFIETGKLQVILAQIGISTVWNLQKVRLQGAVRNLPSVRELEAL